MIEASSSQIIDPRVVHTVRVLKENNQNLQRQVTVGEQTDKEKGNGDLLKNDLDYKPESKKTNEHLSQNNLYRISIDGSISNRRNTRDLSEKLASNNQYDLSESMNKVIIDSKKKNMSLNNNNNNNSYNREQKTKAYFVKSLMNDTSIKKYKAMCISILQKDPQISKLCLDCNIMNNSNSLEYFINKDLFDNTIFLYKLEMLLSSDQVMNKNYKEKFFKNEITKVLNQLYLDIKYQQKMEMLEKSFDEHFQLISKFDFTH